jgi:hypothetical protein
MFADMVLDNEILASNSSTSIYWAWTAREGSQNQALPGNYFTCGDDIGFQQGYSLSLFLVFQYLRHVPYVPHHHIRLRFQSHSLSSYSGWADGGKSSGDTFIQEMTD